MGVRGELFSTKVSLQNRTYFFNVKENRLGDLYLNMVESKNRDEGGFERQSIILFAEDLQEFLQGFDESLKVLEKATREKRRGGPHREGAPRRNDDRPFARPPRREGGDSDGRRERRFDSDERRERRFDEPRFGSRPPRREGFSDRPPRREGAPDRGERRFGGEPRFGGGERPGGDRPGGDFRGGRGGRDDRGGRSERPRRPSKFSEKQGGRKGEGRRSREERKDRDRSPFPPKKRVVVKKR